MDVSGGQTLISASDGVWRVIHTNELPDPALRCYFWKNWCLDRQ